MAGTRHFENFLAQITWQHQVFLAEAASGAAKALKSENQRVSRENIKLQATLRTTKSCDQVPGQCPVPPRVRQAHEGANGNESLQATALANRPWSSPSPPWVEEQAHLKEVWNNDVAMAGAPTKEAAIGLPGMVSPQRPSAIQVEDATPVSKHLSMSEAAVHNLIKKVEEREETNLENTRNRVCNTLKLGPEDKVVTVDQLYYALRPKMRKLTTHRLQEILANIKETYPVSQKRIGQVKVDEISFDTFIQVLIAPKLHSQWAVDLSTDLATINKILVQPSLEEILTKCVGSDEPDIRLARSATSLDTSGNWEQTLNVVVGIVLTLNLVTMGLMLDNAPDHIAWTIVEGVCAFVFAFEAVLKICMWGPYTYFRGDAWQWNLLDFLVTSVSGIELILTITISIMYPDQNDQMIPAMGIVVFFRTLRMVRVFRLLTLLHSPLLKDLANMMLGFLIGLQSLFWVMVLLCLALYIVGLLFRMVFGPDRAHGQNLLEKCGAPDEMFFFDDPDCQVHYMYGEEFFGTLSQSMFTTFRFMIGDYSTRGGKSIVIAFSQGYGIRFDLIFCGFMITMMFGVFNIITAIFVDSTIAGLKHNDMRRKSLKMYERKYVKRKLRYLLERVEAIFQEQPTLAWRRSFYGELSDVNMMHVEFAESDFVALMEDPEVKVLLSDLDVEMHNPANLFETFDFNGNGSINLVEMIKGLMKLRGEPQKNDVIAAWVALRSLHEKVDQIQLLHVDTNSRLNVKGATSRQFGEESPKMSQTAATIM